MLDYKLLNGGRPVARELGAAMNENTPRSCRVHAAGSWRR
jgi:hypothetical protein